MLPYCYDETPGISIDSVSVDGSLTISSYKVQTRTNNSFSFQIILSSASNFATVILTIKYTITSND